MRFINNPFDILFEVMKESYPTLKCDIFIGTQMTDGVETFGCTLFPENEVNPITIEINPILSLVDATEVLAHELAHVIAGEKAEHNEQWEKSFSNIHELFNKKINERFKN